MDIDLREKAFEKLQREETRTLYDGLVDQYENLYGPLDRSAQLLIESIAVAEEQKLECVEDIQKHGAVEMFYQGRQSLRRENPAVRIAQKVCEQQRKALAELKLTPNSRKAAPDAGDDAFDAF